MTISPLDLGRVADALVQLMRSDAPLGSVHSIMASVPPPDWPDIAAAFAARGWQDNSRPVPERGARLHDWLLDPQGDP